MLVMPTRTGFTVEWETEKINMRTGKPFKSCFESRNRAEVEEKQKEMLRKGYKVSEIMECIF